MNALKFICPPIKYHHTYTIAESIGIRLPVIKRGRQLVQVDIMLVTIDAKVPNHTLSNQLSYSTEHTLYTCIHPPVIERGRQTVQVTIMLVSIYARRVMPVDLVVEQVALGNEGSHFAIS